MAVIEIVDTWNSIIIKASEAKIATWSRARQLTNMLIPWRAPIILHNIALSPANENQSLCRDSERAARGNLSPGSSRTLHFTAYRLFESQSDIPDKKIKYCWNYLKANISIKFQSALKALLLNTTASLFGEKIKNYSQAEVSSDEGI